MSSPLCVSLSEFKADHSNALSYLSHVIRWVTQTEKEFHPLFFLLSNQMKCVCSRRHFAGLTLTSSTIGFIDVTWVRAQQHDGRRISSIYSSFCLFTCDDAEEEEALNVLLSPLVIRTYLLLHSTVSNLENKQIVQPPPPPKEKKRRCCDDVHRQCFL